MSRLNYHINGTPKFVVLKGKTVVTPKCDGCLNNDHEYCAKRCGCDCWHQD